MRPRPPGERRLTAVNAARLAPMKAAAWPTRVVAAAAALAAGLALGGCGYTLVGRASNIPEDIRRVFLQPFENRTTRAEVEQFLTQAIADELVTRPRFELVATATQADAVIRGAVTAFRVAPITFTADGRAQEYELTIIADVSFRRSPTPTGEEGETIWANDRYQFKESYEVESADSDFFDRENLAIEDSAERFADTMVTDLLEGF